MLRGGEDSPRNTSLLSVPSADVLDRADVGTILALPPTHVNRIAYTDQLLKAPIVFGEGTFASSAARRHVGRIVGQLQLVARYYQVASSEENEALRIAREEVAEVVGDRAAILEQVNVLRGECEELRRALARQSELQQQECERHERFAEMIASSPLRHQREVEQVASSPPRLEQQPGLCAPSPMTSRALTLEEEAPSGHTDSLRPLHTSSSGEEVAGTKSGLGGRPQQCSAGNLCGDCAGCARRNPTRLCGVARAAGPCCSFCSPPHHRFGQGSNACLSAVGGDVVIPMATGPCLSVGCGRQHLHHQHTCACGGCGAPPRPQAHHYPCMFCRKSYAHIGALQSHTLKRHGGNAHANTCACSVAEGGRGGIHVGGGQSMGDLAAEVRSMRSLVMSLQSHLTAGSNHNQPDASSGVSAAVPPLSLSVGGSAGVAPPSALGDALAVLRAQHAQLGAFAQLAGLVEHGQPLDGPANGSAPFAVGAPLTAVLGPAIGAVAQTPTVASSLGGATVATGLGSAGHAPTAALAKLFGVTLVGDQEKKKKRDKKVGDGTDPSGARAGKKRPQEQEGAVDLQGKPKAKKRDASPVASDAASSVRSGRSVLRTGQSQRHRESPQAREGGTVGASGRGSSQGGEGRRQKRGARGQVGVGEGDSLGDGHRATGSREGTLFAAADTVGIGGYQKTSVDAGPVPTSLPIASASYKAGPMQSSSLVLHDTTALPMDLSNASSSGPSCAVSNIAAPASTGRSLRASAVEYNASQEDRLRVAMGAAEMARALRTVAD